MTSCPILHCPPTLPPGPHPNVWHVAEETAKWKKISYFFGGVIVLPYTVFQLGKHLMHHQCRS